MQRLLASPPLLGWGAGVGQKNVFTVPRTFFGGSGWGNIIQNCLRGTA